MKLTTMQASEFKKMFMTGADNLANNVDLVNALNVFPVPDGDTGTNMNMTFQSGVASMMESSTHSVGELATKVAKGLLMGARGNSGVILSQIFRGFSQAIADLESLDSQSFAKAFMGGVESAYKAVMKPVEGTILTVARESALRGEKKAQQTEDIVEVMESIVKGAQESLDHTPELLPVLKQVGVVDSGGKGLLCIYEGFLASLTGQSLSEKEEASVNQHAHAIFEEKNEHPVRMEDITFGYCTEIMVRISQDYSKHQVFNYEDFRQTLNKMGDSLLVVADDEIIKVHVHTEDPGKVMQLGQSYGELIKIKVENMREQVRSLEAKEEALKQPSDQLPAHPVQEKEFAIIAVASGQGLIDLFKSMGVSYVIAGGQTMNPSTQDFVEAMDQVHAKNILILPNNKNIQMAAEQATQVAQVPAKVVATKSITQGIAAMLMFNPEASIEENQEIMQNYAQSTASGQITTAIRDSQINDISIKENDFMAILDGNIILADEDLSYVLKTLILEMIEDDSELVTLIVGETGSQALADEIEAVLQESHPDIEVEVIQGDQPVYQYFVSVD